MAIARHPSTRTVRPPGLNDDDIGDGSTVCQKKTSLFRFFGAGTLSIQRLLAGRVARRGVRKQLVYVVGEAPGICRSYDDSTNIACFSAAPVVHAQYHHHECRHCDRRRRRRRRRRCRRRQVVVKSAA